MRDYDQIKSDIAQAQADMEKAAKAVHRERRIINALLGTSITLALAGLVMGIFSLATGPTDQQQRYFDVVGDRYGMSQDTATEIATMWCDTGGNPDGDKFANLIRMGTDEDGFDKLAGSRSELVLLTLAAERAYCPKN